jgi:hypothetical protein
MGNTLVAEIEVRHMANIVEYLLYDEQRHFLECSDDCADDPAAKRKQLAAHIFMSIYPVAVALGYQISDEALKIYNHLVSPLDRID